MSSSSGRLISFVLLLAGCTETASSVARAPSSSPAPSGSPASGAPAAKPDAASAPAAPMDAGAPRVQVELLDPGAAPRRGLRSASRFVSQRLRLTTITELRRVDGGEVEDRQRETAELFVSAAQEKGGPRLTGRLVASGGVPITLRAVIDSAAGGVDVGEAPEGLASVSRLSLWREPLPREEVGVGARWRVVRPLSEDGTRLVQTSEYTLLPGREIQLEVERTVRPASGVGPQQLSHGRLSFSPGHAYPSGQFETVAEVLVGGKALRLVSVVRLEHSSP